eukprot:Rmarinus@m.13812
MASCLSRILLPGAGSRTLSSSGLDMKGKVALITGAGLGIGKAVASNLLSAGCKVVVVDHNEDAGKQTVSEFRKTFGEGAADFRSCDVRNLDALEATFRDSRAAHGRLDIVFNNAGIGEEPHTIAGSLKKEEKETTAATWASERPFLDIVAINLSAVIQGTRLAVEIMQSDGTAGVVVNTSSMGGLYPMVISPTYCATKFGVIGFTRSLQYLAHPKQGGIRVNALCPAFTDTALVQQHLSDPSFKRVVDAVNKGELISPESIADAALDLVRDPSKAGAVLCVTTKGPYYPNLPSS